MSSPVLRYIKGEDFPDDPGLISGRLTLHTYAIYCSVPQDFLSHVFHLRDGSKGGIDIPYGRDIPVKHRVRFQPNEEDYKSGDQRFYWDKGAKIKGLLYGVSNSIYSITNLKVLKKKTLGKETCSSSKVRATCMSQRGAVPRHSVSLAQRCSATRSNCASSIPTSASSSSMSREMRTTGLSTQSGIRLLLRELMKLSLGPIKTYATVATL
jgi:hypothetical protein